MLSAGTCVEWLRDDLGLIDVGGRAPPRWPPACDDTGDVWFVPALLGLGTPVWDFGARGTFVGITRGTGRPEMVRAVLEGVAHRGADLLEAAEADTGLPVAALRVDGGMSANRRLRPGPGRRLRAARSRSPRSPRRPPSARPSWPAWPSGTWADEEDVAAAWRPRPVVEPGHRRRRPGAAQRDRWLEARARSEGTIPELSAIDF